ncbi:hypothetical protein B0T16DRAFT_101046 [Cercophora newfieldiana]|uniref:Uncharacterized protein n=1 Tax=Cercophora newfieldiana TaxID=92897 RepID=A0AA39YGS7_9PEZI|nr:hypothetical protein B0T16DRAFT_101046 [Cercophora newfieldiana]
MRLTPVRGTFFPPQVQITASRREGTASSPSHRRVSPPKARRRMRTTTTWKWMAGIAKMALPLSSRNKRASWLIFFSIFASFRFQAARPRSFRPRGRAGVRSSHSALRGTPHVLRPNLAAAGRPQPAELALHFRPPPFHRQGAQFWRPGAQPTQSPASTTQTHPDGARPNCQTHSNPASRGLPTQPLPANHGPHTIVLLPQPPRPASFDAAFWLCSPAPPRGDGPMPCLPLTLMGGIRSSPQASHRFGPASLDGREGWMERGHDEMAGSWSMRSSLRTWRLRPRATRHCVAISRP